MNRCGFVGGNVTVFSLLSSEEVLKALALCELSGAQTAVAHPP